MNLDGLTMSVLAKELNERLQTGQIQKLYQIDKTTLLFKVRALNEDQNLIITVGATPAMYLSQPLQDLPKEPSSLCMFLRKHIEGSRIVKVEQINGDRIMCIQTDKLEMDGSITSTYIYIELMGKYSNCIFVQDGIILESLIHVSPLMNRERIISPKLQYDLPPNANRVSLMDFDNNEIKNLLTSFGNGSVQQSIRANLLSEENEMLTIPLKPNLTIVENAQWYYKLYTKLKNRMVSGEFQLNASTTKLAYLQSILYSISLATTRESLEEIRKECMDAGIIKKSKKPLSYKLGKSNYIHLTIDEGEIFIGRNNQQNEYLTHRFAKSTDIWFHTQDIQGSHLILRLNVEPDDMILSKVAQYAAYFSKARDTSKVPVDYTYIKNIKKPPGSPLGFVIFNTHQTMIVEPKKPENYNE
ncbi:MAG: NFACT family protein [Veillonella sp.]|nr:NFACT family protein [Veillonella sp.]